MPASELMSGNRYTRQSRLSQGPGDTAPSPFPLPLYQPACSLAPNAIVQVIAPLKAGRRRAFHYPSALR